MFKTLRSTLLGVTALCLLLLPASVTAQSVSGDLVGTVYDATGAIVAGASVGAANVNTGVQSSTVSSSTGQYRISNLPVGSYNLKVSAKGFGVAELRNVAVNLSVTSTANVTLQIGESKTVVEVTGSAAVIDTTTAQVESNFDARQMADLPTTSGGFRRAQPRTLHVGCFEQRNHRHWRWPVGWRPTAHQQQLHD